MCQRDLSEKLHSPRLGKMSVFGRFRPVRPLKEIMLWFETDGIIAVFLLDGQDEMDEIVFVLNVPNRFD